MSKNSVALAIVVLLALAVGALIYFQKQKLPKHNWRVTYAVNSAEPYGLKLFYSLMNKRQPKKGVLRGQNYDQLDTNLTKSNLVYVGDEFEIDSLNALELLKYVERGNHVFIASNSCPMEIIRNFVPLGDSINYYEYLKDSIVNVKFDSVVPYPGNYRFHFQQFKDIKSRYWSCYTKEYFKTALQRFEWNALSLYNDSLLNGYYFDHGKGRITISTAPILFTNFYMVQEQGFKHANNFLAQLHEGPTYWNNPVEIEEDNDRAGNNPLQFLFSHPYLRWGWYLMLITVLLYLFFRSKRGQRIIPLMPVNTNASIEYTKAIGTLYFQSKGHQHIAHEMYMIFLAEARTRYNIFTDIEESELIQHLSLKSGVDQTFLFHLFKKFKQVRTEPDTSNDALINLYEDIENYHQKRK